VRPSTQFPAGPQEGERICPAGVPRLLIDWYHSRGRSFPWRSTTDPFRVLMAVFMLQRTGVSQVMNVYDQFIQRYPDLASIIEDSAEGLSQVLRPLGRVDRWPVLKALAAALLSDHGGDIPDDLASLDALPGIGQYSARAVLCLAFGQPRIMLDPNSYRLLSRACGIVTDKVRPHADVGLIERLDAIVPHDDPRAFNLALLDVGSTICRNKTPLHESCPLREVCRFWIESGKTPQSVRGLR
jgi:A/G-specific adenine glycosylase